MAQSNFELAELTRKVGSAEAVLAAHRAVLQSREALAAEPGADASDQADVGAKSDRGCLAAQFERKGRPGARGVPSVGVAAGRSR